jgi:hypothetical protein
MSPGGPEIPQEDICQDEIGVSTLGRPCVGCGSEIPRRRAPVQDWPEPSAGPREGQGGSVLAGLSAADRWIAASEEDFWSDLYNYSRQRKPSS